jgi:WD40 repeat protein
MKVFSGSRDQTIKVWSGGTGALLHTLNVGGMAVLSLEFGRDGTVYSGQNSNSILMWNQR